MVKYCKIETWTNSLLREKTKYTCKTINCLQHKIFPFCLRSNFFKNIRQYLIPAVDDVDGMVKLGGKKPLQIKSYILILKTRLEDNTDKSNARQIYTGVLIPLSFLRSVGPCYQDLGFGALSRRLFNNSYLFTYCLGNYPSENSHFSCQALTSSPRLLIDFAPVANHENLPHPASTRISQNFE